MFALRRAQERGHANHGWLNSYHTFSFGGYYDPQHMGVSNLRVINDDTVAPGGGFAEHGHNDMEIISYVLEGALEHKDSMGNVAVIRSGDVQAMSAGTGVSHSEYNKNRDAAVKFLQIWVLPNKANVDPRYDQITLDPLAIKNRFLQVISPDPSDEGIWIHQDAWFHLGEFDAGQESPYTLKKQGNGLYIFVLEGGCEIGGETLKRRDGLGIWDVDEVEFRMEKPCKLLLMEVPMAN